MLSLPRSVRNIYLVPHTSGDDAKLREAVRIATNAVLESAFVDDDTLATRIVDAGLLGRAEAKEFVARLAELDVLKCLPSESRIQSPFFAESKAIVVKKKWFCLGTNSIFPL